MSHTEDDSSVQALSYGSLDRTIPGAFFPSSPAATSREAILSDLLAEILGARPQSSLLDLRKALKGLPCLITDSKGIALDAFDRSYTKAGRGIRGSTKTAKQYGIPFHPFIAKRVKPEESRSWGKWYFMLMTSGDPLAFNKDLHSEFVERLDQLTPSNLYEKVIVDAANVLEYADLNSAKPSSIRPYLTQLSSCFQEDLR